MRRSPRRLVLGAAVSFLTVVMSALAVTPAHAYGSLDERFGATRTGNCDELDRSELTFVDVGPGCRHVDVVDQTLFRHDPGGIGIKIMLFEGSTMVAKVEFHPQDEVFWVYDTRNDSDTIYVTACFFRDPTTADCTPFGGTMSPTGSSDRIDFDRFDRSAPDGRSVQVSVWDNSNATDLLARRTGRA